MIERKMKNNKTHENEELAHTYTLLAHTTIVSIPITQCQHMRATVYIPITQCQQKNSTFIFNTIKLT